MKTPDEARPDLLARLDPLWRWPLSWALYWLGALVSRLPGDGYWTQPVYQRVMSWSGACQGETDFGPWRPGNAD